MGNRNNEIEDLLLCLTSVVSQHNNLCNTYMHEHVSIKPIIDMSETMKIIKTVKALKDNWVNEPGLSIGYLFYIV